MISEKIMIMESEKWKSKKKLEWIFKCMLEHNICNLTVNEHKTLKKNDEINWSDEKKKKKRHTSDGGRL